MTDNISELQPDHAAKQSNDELEANFRRHVEQKREKKCGELETRFHQATDSVLALLDLISATGDGHKLAPTTLRKAGNAGYHAVEEAVAVFEELNSAYKRRGTD